MPDVGGYNYTKPRGPIGAQYSSPGPIYKMPPLVGFQQHDMRSTHPRGPASSFGARTKLEYCEKSPGPAAYRPKEKMTHHGPDGSPRYSMGAKLDDLHKNDIPGPGTYQPEKSTNIAWPADPKYSFGMKHKHLERNDNPAPNAYKVPRPDITSDKKAGPQYSMLGRAKSIFGSGLAPGPGAYKTTNPDNYLPSSPKHSIGARVYPPDGRYNNPGPGAYNDDKVYSHLPGTPRFTFGMKHSLYKGEYLEKPTDEDEP